MLSTAGAGFAQNFLLLEKVGTTKRIKFAAGDQLKYKLHHNDTIFEDQISAVFDSAVAFGNYQVQFADMEKIWISKDSFWLSRLKFYSLVATTGYFALDAFNRTTNHDSPIVTKGTLRVLAIGVGISVVAHLSQKRWFRVKGNNQIRRLDLSVS